MSCHSVSTLYAIVGETSELGYTTKVLGGSEKPYVYKHDPPPSELYSLPIIQPPLRRMEGIRLGYAGPLLAQRRIPLVCGERGECMEGSDGPRAELSRRLSLALWGE